MAIRGLPVVSVTIGLAASLAGCTQPQVPPPAVVATLPPPPAPPPPAMPEGGYRDYQTPAQRSDGSYVTPNFEMTNAAAVWHLRGALNVAALACDQAGGGVLEGYNAWIKAHPAALDAAAQQYLHEWEETGWGDWRDAYEAQQTRLYNFYSQQTIRVAFCAAARNEIGTVATVADADLPAYARAALKRLDKPFIDFYTAFDAWRDYYAPKVPPPKFVATIPEEPVEASAPSAPVTSAQSVPVVPTGGTP
ncbi:MAG: hypothetical protein E7773_02715 [Sphingomonas sp.]|nr:MAG: hypothetical protein E7773_02715 [Sphingomonas sp.]